MNSWTILACSFVAAGLIANAAVIKSLARTFSVTPKRDMMLLVGLFSCLDIALVADALIRVRPKTLALILIIFLGCMTWASAWLFNKFRVARKRSLKS